MLYLVPFGTVHIKGVRKLVVREGREDEREHTDDDLRTIYGQGPRERLPPHGVEGSTTIIIRGEFSKPFIFSKRIKWGFTSFHTYQLCPYKPVHTYHLDFYEPSTLTIYLTNPSTLTACTLTNSSTLTTYTLANPSTLTTYDLIKPSTLTTYTLTNVTEVLRG